MGKTLLVSSTTYLEDAEEAEIGSSQRCNVIGQETENTCSCMGNSSQIAKKKFLPHGWSEQNMDESHGTSISGDIQTSAGQCHSNVIQLDLLSTGTYSRDLQRFLPNPSYSIFLHSYNWPKAETTKRHLIFPNTAVLCDLCLSES